MKNTIKTTVAGAFFFAIGFANAANASGITGITVGGELICASADAFSLASDALVNNDQRMIAYIDDAAACVIAKRGLEYRVRDLNMFGASEILIYPASGAPIVVYGSPWDWEGNRKPSSGPVVGGTSGQRGGLQ